MRLSRGELFQYSLIALGLASTALFSVFFLRELFPEYRIYQGRYQELEKFRSTYTGTPPPAFTEGIKQTVLLQEDKGPAKIDRCTSCHVALEFEHFSPTRIAKDLLGNPIYDEKGSAVLEPNPDFVWAKLDEKIVSLRDEDKLLPLKAERKEELAKKDLAEADRLEALKRVKVGNSTYSVEKALRMHPLLGKETRPFEFHPIDEYGCTTCHSGNGHALTTDKAHGPLLNGQYEPANTRKKPVFLEEDPDNDPLFSRAYNHKPGDKLLFQTTPLLIGKTIESSCIQCHSPTSQNFLNGLDQATYSLVKKQAQIEEIQKNLQKEIDTTALLGYLYLSLQKNGIQEASEELKEKKEDFTLPQEQREQAGHLLQIMQQFSEKDVVKQLYSSIFRSLGTEESVSSFLLSGDSVDALKDGLTSLLATNSLIQGSLVQKQKTIKEQKTEILRLESDQTLLENLRSIEGFNATVATDIDRLTQGYQKGERLFFTQACFGCHRIAGLARGGVGPELTLEGNKYPWFIKESIVWPQADLKTSTMPNFHLDHEEVEALMTFLLAQKGRKQNESEVEYRLRISSWEQGKKTDIEKAPEPAYIQDLRYGKKVFAEEGCAACHRLKGFETPLGYAQEKKEGSIWFKTLFPEEVEGSKIAEALKKHAQEIDKNLVRTNKEGLVLEELEQKTPGFLLSFYSNFAFAKRSQNDDFSKKLLQATKEEEKEKIRAQKQEWDARIMRVLEMYIQEYGFGRLIAPRPNWSGVYRTDAWLMEHFKNPASAVPGSIMPVFPFSEEKFYALTHLLNELGRENANAFRLSFKEKGFNPEVAFQTLCSQCHGTQLQGNGPVATWIYPIVKNLRNPNFLRNLTKEQVQNSITHGVKGTPMPPWGEVAKGKEGKAVLSKEEITLLVDWIFSQLPGGPLYKEQAPIPKWEYSPEQIIEELKQEGSKLSFSKSALDFTTLIASTGTFSKTHSEELSVEEIFTILPNPQNLPREKAYYIKKKFYTPENLQKGEALFNLHCSVCHGKEGDGAGIRAETMESAKPRMLINLDWLDSRDDLRLLRSIKYGVAGTAMTPWGDQTTSLQRLQLVMYIRSLSEEAKQRELLSKALYEAFEKPKLALFAFMAKESQKHQKTQENLKQTEEKIHLLTLSPSEQTQIPLLVEKRLALLKEVEEFRKKEEILKKAMATLTEEQKQADAAGKSLLPLLSSEKFASYLKWVQTPSFSLSFSSGNLIFEEKEKPSDAIAALQKEIESSLNDLHLQLRVEKGKLPSNEREQRIDELTQKILSLQKAAKSLAAVEKAQKKTSVELQSLVKSLEQGKK